MKASSTWFNVIFAATTWLFFYFTLSHPSSGHSAASETDEQQADPECSAAAVDPSDILPTSLDSTSAIKHT